MGASAALLSGDPSKLDAHPSHRECQRHRNRAGSSGGTANALLGRREGTSPFLSLLSVTTYLLYFYFYLLIYLRTGLLTYLLSSLGSPHSRYSSSTPASPRAEASPNSRQLASENHRFMEENSMYIPRSGGLDELTETRLRQLRSAAATLAPLARFSSSSVGLSSSSSPSNTAAAALSAGGIILAEHREESGEEGEGDDESDRAE